MTSLLCIKRMGGNVNVHNDDRLEHLMIDADDHVKTMLMERSAMEQRLNQRRPHSTPNPTQHSKDVDTNTLIGQSMKVQDWLNEKTIQNVQERADNEARSTRKLYDDLLYTEDTFVRDVDDYLQYKQLLDSRKKELLHKKWNERVHEPIRQQIVKEMNSYSYKELEKRKRELYKEYLEHTNKKGHVFLDTISPEEYFALALQPSRPAPLKAETKHLRDPLISQAREHNNEERAILRCMTGMTYRDRDIEAVKLPPLPLVPLGRHGTQCKTWLEMPLTDIESPVRHASRRRMQGDFNECHFDLAAWSKLPYDSKIVEQEMAMQKKRTYSHMHPSISHTQFIFPQRKHEPRTEMTTETLQLPHAIADTNTERQTVWH